MSGAPSKRRKTSPTASIAVVAPAPESRKGSRPSTSSRASYQSPTKASLSRSHPTILARSPGRRGSEGKGRGLREEVLLGKSNAIGAASLILRQTPHPPEHDDDGLAGNRASTSEAPAITAPNETLSTALSRASPTSDLGSRAQRSPLGLRQPSTYNRAYSQIKAGQSTRDTANMSHPITTAQRRSDNLPNASREPELPPTPTQLGLSPKPDRPRGLAASSSPSSRESRRSRLRSEQLGTSSPLKSKQKMPAARTEEVSRDEIDAGAAEEAPESDVEQAQTGQHAQQEDSEFRNDPEVPEDVLAKRRIRDDLVTQLKHLEAETAQLENALGDGGDADEALHPNLISLLSTPNISCDPKFSDPNPRPALTSIKDPTALDVNPLAFLRAFAPGDLRLTTTTKSSSIHSRLSQAHIVNVLAPPPWPPHTFYASFRVTCDVESKRVVSITSADIRPRHGAGIKELRHWMEARLKNPLHRFDAGTLVWGLGMWWKEAVARAQFFHHIDVTKAMKTPEAQLTFRPNEAVKAGDVQNLLPYIGKTFVELIPAEPYSNRASTNEARKYRQTRLLLKWDLELDWAGEVHTEIGIAGTKVSAKGQEGVKEVFAELMKRNGLDEAVRQVVQLCGGGAKAGKKRNTK